MPTPVLIVMFCAAILIIETAFLVSFHLWKAYKGSQNNDEDTIIMTHEQLREIIRLTISETIENLKK